MTRRLSRRRLLASALGSVLVAGCGYRPGGGDVRWTADSGGFGTIDAVHAPPGGVLTVSRSVRRYDFERDEWRSGGIVTAYDPAEGTTRREVGLPGRVRCHAGAPTGVYVGVDGELISVAPDGTRRWGVDLPGTPVAVDGGDGLVAVLTESGTLRAFDADGTDRWTASIVESDTDEGTLTDDRPTGSDGADGTDAESGETRPPAGPGSVLGISSGRVVAQIERSPPKLAVVDADGTRQWARRGPSFAPARASPTVVEGRLVYLSRRHLGALAVEDGTEQWTEAVGSPHGFAVAGGRCYLLDRTRLSAFTIDGRRRWTFDPPANEEAGWRFGAVPVATADGVYAATGRRLFGLVPDGTERWRARIDARPRDLALADGIVVRTGEHGLVAHWRRDQF
ncbi:PQQ-binding-like beta-propeller repeat protein [Salinigranum sp. GCM10025319]|uniref:outer membrane protein assembly factor BamB family protein n=1 Tax=Salinigranum sp. GCM10025319 TaxID=3252687 RepID=UPI00360D87A2